MGRLLGIAAAAVILIASTSYAQGGIGSIYDRLDSAKNDPAISATVQIRKFRNACNTALAPKQSFCSCLLPEALSSFDEQEISVFTEYFNVITKEERGQIASGEAGIQVGLFMHRLGWDNQRVAIYNARQKQVMNTAAYKFQHEGGCR